MYSSYISVHKDYCNLVYGYCVVCRVQYTYKKKKNELFEEKLKLTEEIEKIQTNGSSWLEPMKEFVGSALSCKKYMLRFSNRSKNCRLELLFNQSVTCAGIQSGLCRALADPSQPEPNFGLFWSFQFSDPGRIRTFNLPV